MRDPLAGDGPPLYPLHGRLPFAATPRRDTGIRILNADRVHEEAGCCEAINAPWCRVGGGSTETDQAPVAHCRPQ